MPYALPYYSLSLSPVCPCPGGAIPGGLPLQCPANLMNGCPRAPQLSSTTNLHCGMCPKLAQQHPLPKRIDQALRSEPQFHTDFPNNATFPCPPTTTHKANPHVAHSPAGPTFPRHSPSGLDPCSALPHCPTSPLPPTSCLPQAKARGSRLPLSESYSASGPRLHPPPFPHLVLLDFFLVLHLALVVFWARALGSGMGSK